MYKIEKKEFGYKLTFSGVTNQEELLDWINESKKYLADQNGNFGVIVDLTKLKPIGATDIVHFRNGQQMYRKTGMIRSAVILKGAMTTLQFREIARKSKIFQDERYLNAEIDADWEKIAINWIKNGIEPQKSHE